MFSWSAAICSLGMYQGTKRLHLRVCSDLTAVVSKLFPELVKIMFETQLENVIFLLIPKYEHFIEYLLPNPCLLAGMYRYILCQAGKKGNFLFSHN